MEGSSGEWRGRLVLLWFPKWMGFILLEIGEISVVVVVVFDSWAEARRAGTKWEFPAGK